MSLTENLDAMEALRHVPLEDRDAFKYALAATMVKNNAHWKSLRDRLRGVLLAAGHGVPHRRRRRGGAKARGRPDTDLLGARARATGGGTARA